VANRAGDRRRPDFSEERKVRRLMRDAKRFVHDESGVTLIEYSLLGCLIAVTCVATVTAVGANVLVLYTAVCNAVSTAISGAAAC
jgi:pilus assembly protein Flp/PilA